MEIEERALGITVLFLNGEVASDVVHNKLSGLLASHYEIGRSVSMTCKDKESFEKAKQIIKEAGGE